MVSPGLGFSLREFSDLCMQYVENNIIHREETLRFRSSITPSSASGKSLYVVLSPPLSRGSGSSPAKIQRSHAGRKH